MPHSQAYAPGIQEEDIIRFVLPSSIVWACDAGRFGPKVELLIEELQIEAETLWQMGALAFATLQRIAHDQAEILTSAIAAVTGPLSEAADPTEDEPPSPICPPDILPVVAASLLRSLDEIAEVIGESHRELSDIHIERTLIWTSTLRRFLGRD